MADVDRCVICGAPVPEGHQLCWICAHGGLGPQEDGCKDETCTIKWKEEK